MRTNNRALYGFRLPGAVICQIIWDLPHSRCSGPPVRLEGPAICQEFRVGPGQGGPPSPRVREIRQVLRRVIIMVAPGPWPR